MIRPYGVQESEDGRSLVFQVWDVVGDIYETSMYLVKDFKNGPCTSVVTRVKYYAVSIRKLSDLLKEAGYAKIERIDDVFFQPVILAIREG